MNNSKEKYLNERRQNIKNELNAKRLNLAIGLPESKFIENIGGIVRTSNAFLCKEVVISSQNYNKHASSGADIWENIIVVDNVIEYLREHEYTLIALEQTPNSISLWDFEFPEKVAIIAGHEVKGNSEEIVSLVDHCIEIPQRGLVESLNVSTATSIAMYEYCRQYRHLFV